MSRSSIATFSRSASSSASSHAGPSRISIPNSTGKPKIAKLPRRSVLEVSGPDARKFLNGQTCKNVEVSQGGYSGFMNASGRVLHTVFIFLRSPDTYFISHDSPSTHPNPLQILLPPFRLRSKVRIKDVSDQWDVYATYGDDRQAGAEATQELPADHLGAKQPQRVWRFGSGGAAESQWSWPNGVRDLGLAEGEVGCWDLRLGWSGTHGAARQILTPKGQAPGLLSTHYEVSQDEYDLHRMIYGLPESPEDIVSGSALPLESCMDVHGGVDFRKGCYLGQELTVRTYHTGATRKRILPVRLFPLSPSNNDRLLSESIDITNHTQPSPRLTFSDLDITYHPPLSSATQRPKPAGKILSTHSAYSTIGLGLVRLEYAEKSWWADPIVQSIKNGLTVGQWRQGEGGEAGGRLIARNGEEEWGVYVDKGRAYGDALEEMKRVAGV